MKFEIKKSVDNQFYFVLVAENGETLVTSEMYTTKAMCKKGISSTKKAAWTAKIIDLS